MENASICQECHVAKWAIGLRLANQSMNKPTVLTLTTNDHNHWCLLLHTIEWHTFTAIDQTDTCQWEVSDCVPKLSSVPALTKSEHTPPTQLWLPFEDVCKSIPFRWLRLSRPIWSNLYCWLILCTHSFPFSLCKCIALFALDFKCKKELSVRIMEIFVEFIVQNTIYSNIVYITMSTPFLHS